ncbi:hypothetical protein HYW54_03490 [Candidatus Gottesmanbacteria bacterium]|nr:hypothetical protein [Candidatus Gottesmanbacteria bacterium]
MRQKKGSNLVLKRALLATVLWVILFLYVFLIPPVGIFQFAIFYFLIFFAQYISFGIFFERRRCFLYSAVIIMLLSLQQIRFLNIVTAPIVLGIFITGEIYFRKF